MAKELNEITPLIPTHVRDPTNLINKLNNLGEMQPNECLFSTDAITMSPNIEREEGITALLLTFETSILHFKENYPIKPFLRVIRLLMANSAFRFGNRLRQKKEKQLDHYQHHIGQLKPSVSMKYQFYKPMFEKNLKRDFIFIDYKIGTWKANK